MNNNMDSIYWYFVIHLISKDLFSVFQKIQQKHLYHVYTTRL